MVMHLIEAITPVRPLAAGEAQSHEGGIVFTTDRWARLRRFLILGVEGGTFYAGERELAIENIAVVKECLAEDGCRVVDTIIEVSNKGLAPKNEPAILALAMVTMATDESVRINAFVALPQVCRTGTHLLHFAAYREALGGGWGRGMRRAVGDWFNTRNPRDLAYQAVKYKSRDKWSLADLLRLSHPIPASIEHNGIYKWIVDGWDRDVTERKLVTIPRLIFAIERLQHRLTEGPIPTSAEAASVIEIEHIPREAVPTELLSSPDIWAALLVDMPMTAMIRNLGKMSSIGLLVARADAERTIVERVTDQDRLRKARVHPIALLAALKVYEQGHGERGKLTWTPSKKVVNALDEAFYLAFGTVTSTHKRIRLALDVSGSMDGNKVNGMPFLTAREASAAMALVTAAVEPDAHFVAYSHRLVGVNIRPSMRLDEVMRTLRAIPMGGTYCSLPIFNAICSGASIDAFCSFTDSETWDGGVRNYGWPTLGQEEQPPTKTASECLAEYRLRSGIPARHAVIALCSNGFTIADPDDAGQMDFCGLDASLPHVLSAFMSGEV